MRLYHNPVSTCSQKVRMVLHEKSLSYEDELIDLLKGEQFAPDYQALNPNAVVPTLIDDDRVIIESTLINEYLDDAYPERSLRSDDPFERHRQRLFCKRIDDALHPACGALTFAIGARPALLQRPREEVEALIDEIPNPSRRETRRSVVELGVKSPIFASAYQTYRGVFDEAETLLTDGDWLTGATFTLADCALMPYVIRMDHLAQESEIERRPNLARWYAAIQQRPAFADAVTRWVTGPLVENFRKAGVAVRAEIAAAVD